PSIRWILCSALAAFVLQPATAAAKDSAKSADAAKSKDAKSSSDKSADKSAPSAAPSPSGVDEETEPGYDTSITRGLSWDLMAGGIPESGSLVEGELGFSGLPRVAYHYSLSPDMSVGGMVTFDYAYWAPAKAFAPSLLLQAPIRLSFARSTS